MRLYIQNQDFVSFNISEISKFVEFAPPPPIVSGCLTNNDCPDYTACQSRKCINPCAAPNVCAPNANCRVTRHQAVCTCPDGYIGSPELSCTLRKLNIHDFNIICSKEKRCKKQKGQLEIGSFYIKDQFKLLAV